jgi:hypothetical protein
MNLSFKLFMVIYGTRLLAFTDTSEWLPRYNVS